MTPKKQIAAIFTQLAIYKSLSKSVGVQGLLGFMINVTFDACSYELIKLQYYHLDYSA